MLDNILSNPKILDLISLAICAGIVATFYLTLHLIIESRVQIETLEPIERVKRKTNSTDKLTKQLNELVLDMTKETERVNTIESLDGKKNKITGNLLKSQVVYSLTRNKLTRTLVNMMMVAGIVMFVASFLTLFINAKFPILPPIMMFSSVMTIMISLNVLGIINKTNFEEEVLTFMETNYFNYQNAKTFTESIENTLEVTNKKSHVYVILQDFLINVKNLNMSELEAIERMKEAFDSIPQVNSYLDTVKKSVEGDPTYKKSLRSIPAYYARMIEQKRDFAVSVKLMGGMTVVGYVIIIIMLVNKTFSTMLDTSNVDVDPHTAIVAFILIVVAAVLFAASTIGTFVMTKSSKGKQWGGDEE